MSPAPDFDAIRKGEEVLERVKRTRRCSPAARLVRDWKETAGPARALGLAGQPTFGVDRGRLSRAWIAIAGGALLLFSAVLLGVGIHHLVATGTCSSTGYSGNYGPVPYCPSGTGWWFAFVFGGIIGCLIGAFDGRQRQL